MIEAASNLSIGVNQRRFRRRPVLWAATLAWDGCAVACVVFNVSANGAKVVISPLAAKVMMREGLAAGTGIVLRAAPFGELAGEVVWSKPTALGIRFRAAPDEVARRLGGRLRLLPGAGDEPG